MTVQCDYFVGTFVVEDPTGLEFQTMLWQVEDGQKLAFRGFQGMSKEGVFIGYRPYDDRAIVQGIGSAADRAVIIFSERSKSKKRSVARFDAQVTFAIDDADRTILFASPKRRYKSMRVSQINDRGETLYVGSPTSAYRLRVYNKTAQANIKPDNGEYIRFEITFRNSLADSAYEAYLQGNINVYFLGYLSQMVDEVTFNLVKHILDKNMTADPRLFEKDIDEGLEKTKVWLESVVVPCIQKLYLRDPEYVTKLVDILDKMLSSVVE